ncbi:MAG: response regulator transcription factor [Verrucomicrobiota bacterium]
MTPTSTSKTIGVLLVDDSALVRQGIKAVFQTGHAAPDIEIVGEAANVADAITSAQQLRPDVVLLDIRLPDGTGFTACREILKARPETRVLILTSFINDNFIYDAITSGAQGYLMKEIDPQGLIQSVQDIAAGKSILSPDIMAGVMRMVRDGGPQEDKQLASLSPQERRVLALVAEGKTNKEIGVALDLSDNTIKNYLVNVFEKLNVKRRSHAAALYIQAHSDKK